MGDKVSSNTKLGGLLYHVSHYVLNILVLVITGVNIVIENFIVLVTCITFTLGILFEFKIDNLNFQGYMLFILLASVIYFSLKSFTIALENSNYKFDKNFLNIYAVQFYSKKYRDFYNSSYLEKLSSYLDYVSEYEYNEYYSSKNIKLIVPIKPSMNINDIVKNYSHDSMMFESSIVVCGNVNYNSVNFSYCRGLLIILSGSKINTSLLFKILVNIFIALYPFAGKYKNYKYYEVELRIKLK